MWIQPYIGLLAVLVHDDYWVMAQEKQVTHANARIVGGQAATDGRYPYAVSLIGSSGNLFCGGRFGRGHDAS
jgi:secreted trypsin-like serine protease